MSKKTIPGLSVPVLHECFAAQGSVSLGFGVEREGVDVVLDYSLPEDCV